MFKKNTKHLQPSLFGLTNSLPESMQKDIEKSSEFHFYNLIFCNIREELFASLYSDKKSRPNSPINAMVASLILMQRNRWTYDQLFDSIKFNILTKVALGLDRIDAIPFCPASIFNFQNRLNNHFAETGENLLEHVFDHLTAKQLQKLKLKTNIQRTDSFLAASNIRNYSRLQLLVEMLIRIYRVLSDEDKQRLQEKFRPYVSKSSGQYIYRLQASDLPHELDKIGQLYLWIHNNIYSQYADYDVFCIFNRVYAEHFTIVEDKITVISSDQLRSSDLQSPDDLDATYRYKNGQHSRGQSINVTETAHPENAINLLTDVAVNPNNVDDAKVLGQRLDKIKRKTADLDELHFDATYGNPENDTTFEKHNITPVQTAIRGNRSAVPIEIKQTSSTHYQVSCPMQTALSKLARKRHKVEFDINICQQCSHLTICPAMKRKEHYAFHFTHEDYLSKKRQYQINEIPQKRRKLRNNVEATVNEFVCKMPGKKLKVRGRFKTSVFAYSLAISINFGRIYRYIQDQPKDFLLVSCFIDNFIKERLIISYLLSLINKILGLIKSISFEQRSYSNKFAFQLLCF